MEFDHPIKEVIKPYFQKFQRIEGYFLDDTRTLDFFSSHHENNNTQDVLLKIGEVRDRKLIRAEAYEAMVAHIVSLDIDVRLSQCDAVLVNEIAQLSINGKKRRFYSFASRYCNYHDPTSYPIYNRVLRAILTLFFKRIKDIKLRKKELRNYQQFKSIMEEFMQSFYSQFDNYRELDKFLWIYGRDILIEFRKQNHLSEDPEHDEDLNF